MKKPSRSRSSRADAQVKASPICQRLMDGWNTLPVLERAALVDQLCKQGNSIRAVARVLQVRHQTIARDRQIHNLSQESKDLIRQGQSVDGVLNGRKNRRRPGLKGRLRRRASDPGRSNARRQSDQPNEKEDSVPRHRFVPRDVNAEFNAMASAELDKRAELRSQGLALIKDPHCPWPPPNRADAEQQEAAARAAAWERENSDRTRKYMGWKGPPEPAAPTENGDGSESAPNQ